MRLIPSRRGEYTSRQTFRPIELAQVCQVDTRQLARWADEGLMPALLTPGGHRRYRRRELAFLPPAGCDPQMLTYEDFAPLLGVTPKTVCRWRNRGRIDVVRLPTGTPRLLRSYADQLLAEARFDGPP